ncbi:superinfection exclusion protein B [Escherichia coli]|nr:superinfection exclusion protein B [Escherichia coli]EET4267721.1 superinfection exclusion protein B [Escherichia coli]
MSNWWQELLRFFLRGLTLQQLIHMLIILIALIIITPASIKEWVDIRNPEILPDHWMYYAMLLCISYVLNRGMLIAQKQIYLSTCQRLPSAVWQR